MPKPAKTRRVHPVILKRARDFFHPLTPPGQKGWKAVRNHQLGSKL